MLGCTEYLLLNLQVEIPQTGTQVSLFMSRAESQNNRGWQKPPVQVLCSLVISSRLLFKTGSLDQVAQDLVEF